MPAYFVRSIWLLLFFFTSQPHAFPLYAGLQQIPTTVAILGDNGKVQDQLLHAFKQAAKQVDGMVHDIDCERRGGGGDRQTEREMFSESLL